jgi:hypothetical protein
MRHNAIALAARPALIVLAPQKGAVSRRLSFTKWQTHSWTKKIIKLESAQQADKRRKPCVESYGGSRGIRRLFGEQKSAKVLSRCSAVKRISRPPSVVASSTQSSARMSGHRAGKGRMSFPCAASCPFRNF